MHETNYDHFVIQIDSNGLCTKETMTILLYRLTVMGYARNNDHFVIQIDSNGLCTKETMTILLYRLTVMGYARNKL